MIKELEGNCGYGLRTKEEKKNYKRKKGSTCRRLDSKICKVREITRLMFVVLSDNCLNDHLNINGSFRLFSCFFIYNKK